MILTLLDNKCFKNNEIMLWTILIGGWKVNFLSFKMTFSFIKNKV